jgi:drug/metabolite transporter (DMT)-like permease
MSSLIGVLIAAIGVVSKSFSEILSKENFLHDVDVYVNSWALRFFALPFLFFLFIISGGIPEIEQGFYSSLAITVPIGIVSTVLYMKALDVSDISTISPIAGLSPLLLLITTPLIVNEFPSTIGLVGIMMATAGVYLLKINEGTSTGILKPFKLLSNNPGAKYILLVVLLYSISAPVDKIAVEASTPIMYTLSHHIGVLSVLTPLMVYKNGSETVPKIRDNFKWISAVGVLSGLASLLQMIALTYTLVVYVIAAKRCGILISVLYGAKNNNERFTKQRIISTVAIIIGLILMSISFI